MSPHLNHISSFVTHSMTELRQVRKVFYHSTLSSIFLCHFYGKSLDVDGGMKVVKRILHRCVATHPLDKGSLTAVARVHPLGSMMTLNFVFLIFVWRAQCSEEIWRSLRPPKLVEKSSAP